MRSSVTAPRLQNFVEIAQFADAYRLLNSRSSFFPPSVKTAMVSVYNICLTNDYIFIDKASPVLRIISSLKVSKKNRPLTEFEFYQ